MRCYLPEVGSPAETLYKIQYDRIRVPHQHIYNTDYICDLYRLGYISFSGTHNTLEITFNRDMHIVGAQWTLSGTLPVKFPNQEDSLYYYISEAWKKLGKPINTVV
jgi:hypothetical protein